MRTIRGQIVDDIIVSVQPCKFILKFHKQKDPSMTVKFRHVPVGPGPAVQEARRP